MAAVVFAIFEFTFYWCIILSVAWALWRAWQWYVDLIRKQAPAV